MDWNSISRWMELLAEVNFNVAKKPQKLKTIKLGDNLSLECFTIAFDDSLPVVVHLASSAEIRHSDVKSLLRRAYNHGAATSPCVLTWGTDAELGIYVCTDLEDEAFQFINLVEPESYSDTISDLKQAASKANTSDKVTVFYKALDFETLSRKFFESANECKDLFEKDIFNSTRLAKNDSNAQSVSHYSIILMARLIFLHFLEQKSLLNKDLDFIRDRVVGNDEEGVEPERNLWQSFFRPLFEVLNKPSDKRKGSPLKNYDFPYLNGGLFATYEPIESMASFEKLRIADESIQMFYEKCLYKYRMTTAEDTKDGGQKGVLDPELLGTIFERFMKDDVSSATGSVYTPKDVVLYSVRNSLTRYYLGSGLPEKTAFDLVHHKNINKQFADTADSAFSRLKLTDPCCGSGAFLLTALHELFEVKRAIRQGQGKERWHNGDQRRAYESILRDNIFGLDINPEAIILCHLRLWLPIIDLIDGSSGYDKIKPLPNLGLNVRIGNSLINEKADWESPPWQKDDVTRLAKLRTEYFSCENSNLNKVKSEFDDIANQDDAYVRLSRNFLDITMSTQGGFNVIVGNPPYLGLKDTKKIEYLKNWEELTGEEISDMYIMFTKESLKALCTGGILSYVTSNTYFTDSGKESFRNLLLGQSKEFPTSNFSLTDLSARTFKGVGVHAAIFTVNKRERTDKAPDVIRVIHATTGPKAVNAHLSELNDDPETYARRDGNDIHHVFTDVPVATIRKIPRHNLFIPNRSRLDFLNRFGEQWTQIYDQVWPMIETSRKTEQNAPMLESLRKQLSPFDLTLIGLIADGGVGLQTGSNAVHLAVLKGSGEAQRIEAKIIQTESDISAGNKAGKKALKGRADMHSVVKNLKKSGHPYAEAEYNFVYKIIDQNQILDVSKLSEAEFDEIRNNGISKKMAKSYGVKYPTYVPYYKGQDSDFNRWHSLVTFYIDWSEDNVTWMKGNSGKKFKGAPVVRNPQFYFKPGFCWNTLRSDVVQGRIFKYPGINDVNCMKLNSLINSLPDSYLCAYLNSSIVHTMIKVIANTVQTQINDIKCLPIVVPSAQIAKEIEKDVITICTILEKNTVLDESTKTKIRDIEARIDSSICEVFNNHERVA